MQRGKRLGQIGALSHTRTSVHAGGRAARTGNNSTSSFFLPYLSVTCHEDCKNRVCAASCPKIAALESNLRLSARLISISTCPLLCHNARVSQKKKKIILQAHERARYRRPVVQTKFTASRESSLNRKKVHVMHSHSSFPEPNTRALRHLPVAVRLIITGGRLC